MPQCLLKSLVLLDQIKVKPFTQFSIILTLRHLLAYLGIKSLFKSIVPYKQLLTISERSRIFRFCH